MSLKLSKGVWRLPDLSAHERLVFLALADHANDDGAECYPSVERIARMACCTDRTVQKALNELERRRLIRRHYRTDRTTMYLLNVAALIEGDAEASTAKEQRFTSAEFSHAHLVENRGDQEPDLFTMTPEPHAMTPEPHDNDPRTTFGVTIIREPSEEPLFSGSDTLPAVRSDNSIDDELVKEICRWWNEAAKTHPGIQAARLPLDPARADAIKRRSKQTEAGQTVMDMWRQFFANIDASPFLQGRVAPRRGSSKPFALSMTWALKSANFNEIMEGKYGAASDGQSSIAPDGRELGPTEQAARDALARRRADRERRRGGGNQHGHYR